MYVDYRYYQDEYLLGREPAVPEEEFLYYEKKARVEIDRLTYDRIKGDITLLTEEVKECVCELVEFLYTAAKAIPNDEPGPLSSYSNDGDSGSYDLSRSCYTEEGKKKKVYEVVYRYLVNTGLMYCGVD